MYIDTNNFLSLSSQEENHKLYTHKLSGQVFSDQDHSLLVWHKGVIKETQRKDLGKSMQVVQVYSSHTTSSPLPFQEKYTIPHPLALFSGFDEISGQNYYFFPKISGKSLEEISKYTHDITIIDLEKGWFYVQTREYKDLLGQLYDLYLVRGKTQSKHNKLLSFKIQISIPLPFFSRKDILDDIVLQLQKAGYIIAGYCIEHKNSAVYEISSNDYEILGYLQENDKRLASLEKITTKEIAQQVQMTIIEQYPESKNLITTSLIKLLELK